MLGLRGLGVSVDEHEETVFNWTDVGRMVAGLGRDVPKRDILYGNLLVERPKPTRPKSTAPPARETNAALYAAAAEAKTHTLASRTASSLKAEESRNADRHTAMLAEIKKLQEHAPLVSVPGMGRVARLSLVHTLLDPWSFSQSVENVFYFAYLVKTGRAEVQVDDAGMLVLHVGDRQEQIAATHTAAADDSDSDGYTNSRSARRGRGKSSAVSSSMQLTQTLMSLDVPTWRELCERCNVTQPALTHRDSLDSTAPSHAHVEQFYSEMPHRQAGAEAMAVAGLRSGAAPRRAAEPDADSDASDASAPAVGRKRRR